VSFGVLLPVPATSIHAIVVSRSTQGGGSHVNFIALGQLQLSSVRISDVLLQQLKAIQNTTARLMSGSTRCDIITPILLQLHWLPVWQRVELKVAVLVYKAFNDLTPWYLTDDCQLVLTASHQLRSSTLCAH